MAEKKFSTFEVVVIVLLLLNTFILGGIWCSVKGSCGTGFCPWSKKSGDKICPITGKTLRMDADSKSQAQGS